jgi:hypothetical protein
MSVAWRGSACVMNDGPILGEAGGVCGVHPGRYDETLFSTELAAASAAMLLCGYSYSYSLQSSLTGVRIGWFAVV